MHLFQSATQMLGRFGEKYVHVPPVISSHAHTVAEQVFMGTPLSVEVTVRPVDFVIVTLFWESYDFVM